jgi:hypothetical protein
MPPVRFSSSRSPGVLNNAAGTCITFAVSRPVSALQRSVAHGSQVRLHSVTFRPSWLSGSSCEAGAVVRPACAGLVAAPPV